jgi:hypothetical protein
LDKLTKKKQTGIEDNMDDYDANACMGAFSKFCDEAERNELTSNDEYQYWVFERGYYAAMQEVAKTLKLRRADRSAELTSQMAANRQAYQ